jgi:DNA-binding NarL/FixJ family response regulator
MTGLKPRVSQSTPGSPDGAPALRDETGAPGRLRVVIADGDPLVRRVLRGTLESSGIVVLADVECGEATVEAVLRRQPDLVVIDPRLRDGEGLNVIRRIRRISGGAVPVVVLSSSGDDELGIASLHAGAVGFLSKEMELDGVARALDGVAGGEAGITRQFAREVVEHLQRTPDGASGLRPVRSELTPRQWEVLDLLCSGATDLEIAEHLYLSTETVRSHIKQIRRRLGARSRGEVVKRALELRSGDDADGLEPRGV